MDETQQHIAGQAAATAMVLESLIDLLIMRGVLSRDDVVEAIDVCAWSVEEQPTSAGLPIAMKAAQHAVLQSLLARLAKAPAAS